MVFTQNIPTNIKFYLDKNSIIRKTLNKGLCHFYTGCRALFDQKYTSKQNYFNAVKQILAYK